MNNIQICIPCKGVSIRCPNKNKILLPYTINYIGEELDNNFDSVTIISDTEEHKDDRCNFHMIDNPVSEFYDAYQYIKDITCDEVILMYATHPLRDKGLLKKFIEYDLGDNDFVVSSYICPDRSIFNIKDNKFIIESDYHKGCMCKDVEQIYGSIYKLKKEFLGKCALSSNSNYDFWHGRFSTILTHVPLLDIDTLEDLNKFNYILNYVSIT